MRIDTPFIIGDWQVEPDLGRIMRGDERRAVRPQVMNLLVYLASQNGAMVKSESLLQDLWPNKVVTDATLYNCIAELRRLLDDGADQRRYIETVHKRGYRLLQPTEFPSARRADAEQRLSGNPEAQEALQLGMQRLSRHNLEGWKQAESYFQRAATLDPQNAVAWQKLAESIVAQFGTFEKSADQFYRALQAAERAIALDDSNGFAWISRAKAEAAIAKIEARDVPERRLLGMYQRASELLPDSDDAARELGAFLVRIPNKAAAAIQHLESAVRLDPLRAENHFALGQAYRLINRPSDALKSLLRACELEPDNPYPIWDVGLLHYHRGNLADAMHWSNRACEFERDDPSGPFLLAHIAINLGCLDLAEDLISQGMAMAPEVPISIATQMALADVQGRTAEAQDLARRLIPVNGELQLVHSGAVAHGLWVLRDLDIQRGDPGDALLRYQHVVPELFGHDHSTASFPLTAAIDVAYLYRVMGDRRRANELLENARAIAAQEPIMEREIDSCWLLIEATLLLGDQAGAESLLRQHVRESWVRWWHYTRSRPTIGALRDSDAFIEATAVIEAHRDRERARYQQMANDE